MYDSEKISASLNKLAYEAKNVVGGQTRFSNIIEGISQTLVSSKNLEQEKQERQAKQDLYERAVHWAETYKGMQVRARMGNYGTFVLSLTTKQIEEVWKVIKEEYNFA